MLDSAIKITNNLNKVRSMKQSSNLVIELTFVMGLINRFTG
jgi:hypothetical protein